jgi:hypothetical protein
MIKDELAIGVALDIEWGQSHHASLLPNNQMARHPSELLPHTIMMLQSGMKGIFQKGVVIDDQAIPFRLIYLVDTVVKVDLHEHTLSALVIKSISCFAA